MIAGSDKGVDPGKEVTSHGRSCSRQRFREEVMFEQKSEPCDSLEGRSRVEKPKALSMLSNLCAGKGPFWLFQNLSV